ncbi:alpha-amylase family protein [Paenibacillus sp.]|uniref:alpha-amylase family protein n=1 Tax=Paenibacillus sp. TaxID=58172 RepID=UPI002D50472E|nr:alpha-amylase family protein [Paenibacillus sp.]HZG88131.1 alpha-amylase family protein [Paenibacillus sp.]
MRQKAGEENPWYRRTLRWGQTNLTEMDPQLCDFAWWRSYWKETKVQGLIVNAGGIVAYYPSDFALQYRAEGLGERDLFGDFVRVAREEGLVVLARMDINRATKAFYDAQPDWFVVDAEGVPPTSDGRYFSCINSDYYKTFIPEVLREIVTKYGPEGFTDNSWTGYTKQVCHCVNCKKKFKFETGFDLPAAKDWGDPAYREWVRWSYGCRLENWDLFNRVTMEAGGKDCLWLGMVNANPIHTHGFFYDLKDIGERSKIIMCDHQSRDSLNGFEQNGMNGQLLQSVSDWDVVVPESMANYVRGVRTFRQGSNPPLETRLWMLEGIAGGISPWYHHIGAVQEDRRQYENAVPVMQWHEANEAYLYDRAPAATVGLVWSQMNTSFFGRDEIEEQVALPWHGFARALTRARIPYIPVHADQIGKHAGALKTLILPDVAAMTDAQCEAVASFVEAGGSLIVTGASGTLDGLGEPRDRFPLEDLLGISHLYEMEGSVGKQSSEWSYYGAHNYFRLPKDRHPVLAGFENTDILPFGGKVHRVRANGSTLQPIATYIPSYPIYPPEFSWMRVPQTDVPVLFAGRHQAGGRLFYFAGDVDRCYGRTHLPDLGDLLAAAVRWASEESLPLQVEGPGYLDCRLYRQEGRLVLHIVNLSGSNQHGYVEEYYPVGPLTVSVKADGFEPTRGKLRVAGGETMLERKGGWVTLRVDAVRDHELIVFE